MKTGWMHTRDEQGKDVPFAPKTTAENVHMADGTALESTLAGLSLSFWPIGSIYMSSDEVNPSKRLGGTWVAFNEGALPRMWKRIQPPVLDINTANGMLYQQKPETYADPVYRLLENGDLIMGYF